MTDNAEHRNGGADSRKEQRRRLRSIPPTARWIGYPLAALVLIHTLVIAIWVAPMTPIREEIGDERVRSYVMPWFEQNWSIFAPNPRRTAVTFEVRALTVGEDGENEPTEWIDLVDLEDDIVSGNPAGTRTSKLTRRTADRLHSSLSHMNDTQLEWIDANYVETPISTLRERLLDVEGGTGEHHVDRYLEADASATAVATAVAERTVEGEILHVQYRTSTRGAPSWDNRDNEDLDERSPNYRDYGWRTPTDLSQDQLDLFDHYLDGLEGQ